MVIIITYDIQNDKKRNKLFKLLNKYGERVQRSVFESVLSRGKYRKLTQELKNFELKEGDSIIIYSIVNAQYMEKWRLQRDIQKGFQIV